MSPVTFNQLVIRLYELRAQWIAAGVGSPLRPEIDAEYTATYREFESRGGLRRLQLLLWCDAVNRSTHQAD